MSVFLSWSGERSRQAAIELRALIEGLYNDNKLVWMSDEDIHAGERWRTALDSALSGAEVAILCLTPESVERPWILFEAGAISGRKTNTRIIPYLLFGLQLQQLPAPFTDYDCATANYAGTFRVLQSINNFMPVAKQIERKQLEDVFHERWLKFSNKLESAAKVPAQPWRRMFEPPPAQSAYERHFANASEIWLIGVTVEDALSEYRDSLIRKLQAGCRLRVLIERADDVVLYAAILRKSGGRVTMDARLEQKRAEIANSKGTLAEIVQATTDQNCIEQDRVLAKETIYPLAYGATALDPTETTGAMYIKLYPYRVPGTKPVLVLHANHDHAYQHYWSEIQALWKEAESLTLISESL